MKSLRKLRERATPKYFWLSLLGRLKGEKARKKHNITCVNINGLGINVRRIIYRLFQETEVVSVMDGPGITNYKGALYTTNEIDQILQEILE